MVLGQQRFWREVCMSNSEWILAMQRSFYALWGGRKIQSRFSRFCNDLPESKLVIEG